MRNLGTMYLEDIGFKFSNVVNDKSEVVFLRVTYEGKASAVEVLNRPTVRAHLMALFGSSDDLVALLVEGKTVIRPCSYTMQ